jgi:hypothetical protein
MRAGEPVEWADTLAVGAVAGAELPVGVLTDPEAQALSPVCRDEIALVLRRPMRAASGAEEWTAVVSRLVVDAQTGPRGQRRVQTRAVAEIRVGNRPVAVSMGTAQLVSGFPSLRADQVEPKEVEHTVRKACGDAAKALLQPRSSVAAQDRARILMGLQSVSTPERVEAARSLATVQDPVDGPLLLNALKDPSPDVRRWAALGLGQMGFSAAAESLASTAELDPEYAVRLEAVASLNKLLVVAKHLKPAIRSARAEAKRQREVRTTPESGDAVDGPSRVLDLSTEPSSDSNPHP